ncbi:MAG TPA: 6-phosphofructokinase [Candidatus Merdenecus merdavium]|nr:6-phosphofructokinase [Candidatus Merdenecus merdavium]
MNNVLVGQSGGPTAVINASLYGVITESLKHRGEIDRIYGAINGIEGFLKGQVVDLERELDKEDLEALKTTPAAYLGSCRYKLPEDLNNSVYQTLFDKFSALDIKYFLYIGGNDSMDTVSKLSAFAKKINSPVRVLGIPKTIDNDLVHTDHTPGFGSAAKYVASTVREVCLDASIYDKPSVTIVEIMGRHAGWLTASSVLARKYPGDNPALIYLPEVAFSEERFLDEVQKALKEKTNVVVCVSEGINDGNGVFICEHASNGEVAVDNFGHKMLTGCGKYLENFIKNKLDVKVRSIELNVLQRSSSGYASLTDIQEAAHAGAHGIEAGLSGETGKMISFVRAKGEPYSLSYETVDVSEVCNKEKAVPVEWITKNGTDLSDEMIEYIKPLIQGEPEVPMKGGLPYFPHRPNK